MSETTMQLSLGKKKLTDDFRTLLADVDELLKLSASASGEGIDTLRSRVQDQVQAVRSSLAGAQDTACSQAGSFVQCANEYVIDKPWRSIGIGVGVGVVLGALVMR